jgi:hypothetical protein
MCKNEEFRGISFSLYVRRLFGIVSVSKENAENGFDAATT